MIHSADTGSRLFQAYAKTRHAPVVMQVLPALNSGGVEQGVIDINAAIVKAGGHSIVVSNGGARVHEITRGGGMHLELPVHSKNPFVMIATIHRLRKMIREMNVDIVHACSRAPAWVALKAVEGTGARFMTSCHAAHGVSNNLKRLYNTVMGKGERVIAVSAFIADYLQEHLNASPDVIRVVHRGVAIERFHPNAVSPERLIRLSQEYRIPEGASVIMLPARLTRIKGHMLLLDAIQRLKRRDVFCLFVGSDAGNESYRAELEADIAAKDMGGMVRIVPNCRDMPAAYMLATVVTCPSIVPEGFGRVPIEAQAMGRPIVATDHGGARETILRDDTGWLVPPGDAAALAAALSDALSLTDRERALLATRAMGHVADHFTNNGMCDGTLDVYAELLNAGAPALSAPEDAAQGRLAA